MRIAEFTAYRVQLPLRKPIQHASAIRDASENVVIRCRLADGTEGWGEGVPREYVTGESPQGALRQLAETQLADQIAADCQTWGDVIDLCDRIQLAAIAPDPRGCSGNALRCALEISILDAFGRLFNEPLCQVVEHFQPAAELRARSARVRYSGAITAASRWQENITALKIWAYGFRQCKVKVGMPGTDDARRLRRLRGCLGWGIDLRLDANEAWRAEEVVSKVEPLLDFDVSCIEQPVSHAEIEVVRELRGRLPVKVMLDESLTGPADARSAIQMQTADLFNIRLSKCGGFLNSLRLAALAHRAGLGYQLGCHPGESGILSAAGRHWACSVNAIRYLEGSYDRHLLKEPLTLEDLTFGYGGWAPALNCPGLSVTVDHRAVQKGAIAEQRHSLC